MTEPVGTGERTALVEIEARLHTLQTRFNLYTAQHQGYRVGTVLALGAALLMVLAFSLSGFWFSAAAWPLFGVAGVLCFRLLRRAAADWADPVRAARRVDAQLGLKQRLATLATQTAAGVPHTRPASRLWTYLVRDNRQRLNEWDVKRAAPSRVPWSLLPFLAALLLAFATASVPMLSPASETTPFSLTNLARLSDELPERTGQLVDERLFPDPADAPDSPDARAIADAGTDAPLSGQGQDGKAGEASESAQAEDSLGEGLRDLAALPEDLQQALREALPGLQEPDDASAEREAGEDRLAGEGDRLRPEDDLSLEDRLAAQTLGGESGNERGTGQDGTQGSGDDAAASGQEGAEPADAQRGSGLQRLQQARLDPRGAAAAPQPGGPQQASRGGRAGRGGQGAGTGTDPRLYGDAAALGGGPQTFSLSLDASFEKGRIGSQGVKDEGGGVIVKSTGRLSDTQAFDDAIRNARVPPEYEDIVKNLFSRGDTP